MSQPKDTLEKIQRIINGWETLAPEKSFGYTRPSERKTGLTRKKSSGKKNGGDN